MNRILTWLLGTDPGELVGNADWRFGFVAEYSNYANLALLAVFAAMVYLIVRSYRREGQNPPAAKVVLSALRIGVCLLVLAVVFQPAIVLRFTRTLYSSVLVLIDDSRSMSFTDRYDGASQDALAKRLGASAAELTDLSRSQIVRRSLGGSGGVLHKLAEDHPLMLMRFSTDQAGQEAYTRPLGQTVNLVADKGVEPPASQPTTAPAGVAEVLGRLTANGFETDIPAALRDGIESVVGRRVAGIVLVSDGQMTTEGARGRLADAVAYANQRGVRLFPVLVGDPTPPKNVAVTGLQAPQELRRGHRTEFTVVLAHRNLQGQSVTVKLLRRPKDANQWTDTGVTKTVVLDGQDKAAPAPVEAAGEKGIQSVALQVEPDQIGQFVYRAVAEPRPDERNTADNFAEANVKVTDDKIKVLLIGCDAGWEFQYLRNFLHRQPELYRLSVWQQNADKEVNQAASTGMRIDRLPASLAELIGVPSDEKRPGYDVVILNDPEPTVDGFDGNFAKNLREFVERHGGGLCYIAGNKHSAVMGRGASDYEPLAAMLPVELGANTSDIIERIGQRQPEAWPVRITSYGADHPVTRLGGTAEESEKVWQILPGIYWSHPVLAVKPLARTLAVSSNPLRRTAKNDPEPLLVTQPFGAGRVLYVGFDDTWRWRYIRDSYYHQLFWSNVVSYLATLRARHVVITAGGDRFSAGERITIEVEAYDENFKPLTADTFDVTMTHAETGKAETIVLKAVAGKPGRYKATIRAAQTGTFELTALKGDPLAKDKVQPKTIRIELPKAEAVRTEADRATMENLATRPENFLTIAQADQLARLIPSDRKTVVHQVPRELWDKNLMLLLIVLLLSVEWILRKKYNMA